MNEHAWKRRKIRPKFWPENLKGKDHWETPWSRWEDSKIDLEETKRNDVDYIHTNQK
jgi:hypothetical protein